MKTFNILLIFISASFIGCQNKPKKNNGIQNIRSNYKLMADYDGILVEEFDSTVVDENKYNQNNNIYKVDNSFKYKFEHITTDNKIKYFKVDENQRSWEFVDKENIDSTTIKFVKISVANGNPMAKHIPDYNQTTLRYQNVGKRTFSMSGAIENEGNIWIHPPRDDYFEILELNPFPYIKTPFKVGNEWTWNLRIGSNWADKRWKVWEDQINNEYEYEITEKKNLTTELGEIECYVIESTAISRIGETKLTAFFNINYGFVKLNYTNIDGSKTNLELIEHSDGINGR